MNHPALSPFSFNGPALIIRAEYAELIRKGYKPFEVRNYSFPAKYDGQQVAIYASKRAPLPDNLTRINASIDKLRAHEPLFFRNGNISGEVRGAVVALANLESCSLPMSLDHFGDMQKFHFAPSSFFQANKSRFWRLENITPLKTPFFVDAPRGAVVWFHLNTLDTVPETKL